MLIVALTALGVGGATVIGALLGVIFKNLTQKYSKIFLSFAGGIMLSAAVFGLILPSLENGGDWSLLVTVLGIFAGAVCLNLIDKLTPHLHKMIGTDIEEHKSSSLNKILLFVIAIAIHNLPEGIAAGVGFGNPEDQSTGILIAIGIALQNIPEGMVIIAPMISAGVSKKKAFGIAALTGLIEVIGTFVGYFAVKAAEVILPFALAFAGGTLLYVVSDDMIPETHADGNNRGVTFALLVGFCFMLAMDVLLG
ncbi:MAG: ZIP family metal transporter [Clostridia bacterium]|nr:ZIP family metal transporter [Clostridia bacterium]